MVCSTNSCRGNATNRQGRGCAAYYNNRAACQRSYDAKSDNDTLRFNGNKMCCACNGGLTNVCCSRLNVTGAEALQAESMGIFETVW